MRLAFCVLLLVWVSIAQAQLPVYGKPVAELQAFDDAMQTYMAANGIESGVLAVSRFGTVVYQRGFGVSVEENTLMRIASLEKPITAAAIRMLVADGLLDLDDFAFDLGQSGGGILSLTPWNGLGDSRLRNITVRHLLNHQGGWDRQTADIIDGTDDNGDPQFLTLQISQAMGGSFPADRDDLIRYMLSRPLEYGPGTNGCMDSNGAPFYCYSNFGFMVLGRIVETVSGMSHLDFIRSRVLTPRMWVPAGEVVFGRSLFANKHPSEPFYQGQSNCTNIFDADGPPVNCPYGAWYQEAFRGHGNIVAPVGPLLAYMNQYQVAVQMAAGTPLNPGQYVNGNFNGALDGTSTRMRQRSTGVNIAVLFTRWDGVNHGSAMSEMILNLIASSNLSWPSQAVDGYWLDSRVAGDDDHLGSYDFPFRSMNQVLGVGAGTRLRLKPTVTLWTGTISHKMLIDSPEGTARIGG